MCHVEHILLVSGLLKCLIRTHMLFCKIGRVVRPGRADDSLVYPYHTLLPVISVLLDIRRMVVEDKHLLNHQLNTTTSRIQIIKFEYV